MTYEFIKIEFKHLVTFILRTYVLCAMYSTHIRILILNNIIGVLSTMLMAMIWHPFEGTIIHPLLYEVLFRTAEFLFPLENVYMLVRIALKCKVCLIY